MCDDHDVDAWLKEAKSWKGFAHQIRDLAALKFGPDTAKWPELARYGELAYVNADKILASDLGFFDGSKVDHLAAVQRQLKLGMEAWAVALEQAGTVIEPGKLVGYDASENPDDVPPVIPPAKLPDLLGGVNSALKIAAVGAVVVLAVVLLRRK